MIYGIILSAGKQSRYDDFIPKALADLLLFNNYKGFNFNTIQEFNKRKESF